MKTNCVDYVCRCIRYLERHHARVYALNSYNKELDVVTVTLIYKDLIVMFAHSVDRCDKVKTTTLETSNCKNIDNYCSLSYGKERSRLRYFLQGVPRAVE